MSQQILEHVESNSLKEEIDKFEIGANSLFILQKLQRSL